MFNVALALLGVAAIAAAIPPSDFVVIGGGTAGCTVAATLCAHLPRATVTLVERGERRDRATRLQSESPRKLFEALANPNLTAVLRSRPNAALNNRSTDLLLGANLGGGSAVNGGQLLLPPRGTFDAWPIAGLSDDRAERLFARLRAAQPDTGVPPPKRTPAYSAEWLRAAAAAGLPFTANPYARPRSSSASFDTRIAFTAAGKRMDACRTFLRPARDGACRGRVRLLRGMLAERVLFRRGRVARSVVLTRRSDGTKSRLFARREVLIAAGAIESAALLLRSGVGPRASVKNVARRFVRDLPVGKTLHSRAVAAVSSIYGAPLAPGNDPSVLSADGLEPTFRSGRGGALATAPFGAQARFEGLGYGGVQSAFLVPLFGLPILTTSCISDVSPVSFGSVRIDAKLDAGMTARTPPIVDLRLLERDEDIARIAACVERLRDIHKQLEPLINATESFSPGQSAEILSTREGIIEKVRAEAATALHYVGTCAAGKVLDDHLRVLGLQRLRVVDSAAIPVLPRNAGPMASVYIVALHAAELVAKDNGDLA